MLHPGLARAGRLRGLRPARQGGRADGPAPPTGGPDRPRRGLTPQAQRCEIAPRLGPRSSPCPPPPSPPPRAPPPRGPPSASASSGAAASTR
ncbi:MAG: hypothetical protein ACK559_38785 [bacterium]